MASYQQVIELVVKGQEQLAKLENRVKQLNKEADRLKTEPAKSGTGALAETIQEAATSQKALNKATSADLRNRIKLNAAVDLYGRRLKQIQTTAVIGDEGKAQKQFAQRLEDIQAAFQVFKKDKDIGGIQSLGTELGRILETSKDINRSEVGRLKSQGRLQDYIQEINRLKQAGLKTSKVEQLVEKAKVNLGTNRFRLAEGLEVRIKRRLALLKKEEQQINRNKVAAKRRADAAARKRGQRFQDLALGAGFPLLFGGGAGQVLGGIGGAVAGGGFGGQIIGSAIGGIVENFISSTAQLGQALNETAPDMEKLAEAIGAVGNEEGRRLELLKELQGETAAFNAAQKELADLVGQDGIDALKELGSDTIELSNEFTRFITIVQAGLAELINSAGILKSLTNVVSRAVAARQAETSQDPRLVALRKERESLGPGIGSAARELEIRRQMIAIQLQINQGREQENQLQRASLEKALREKEQREALAKAEKENASVVREAEQRLFQIRQESAASVVELERARFDAQLSTLQLQEAGLQRELQGLQARETSYGRQKQLVNEIAENQIKQARIQNQVAKLQNKQGVVQARIAQQQIKFEVQKINLQIQSLQLQAQGIENEAAKAEMLSRVAVTEQQITRLTREMVQSGQQRLNNAIEIARQKDIVADNILRGKLESIEAERVEARRTINARSLAVATGQAANEAARLNSNMSKGISGVGGLGSKKTYTASTSIAIDPDVRQSVMERAPAFGYRSPYELIEALEKAQKIKNARMTRPRYSSYDSKRSSSGRGGSTSVNVKTGPVMQFDNQRYVTMEDFETSMRDLASAMTRSGRSYGSRRYTGIS